MDFSKVKSVAVYPAIGIARVGNSRHEYFIGPTIPGQPAHDPDDFRDSKGRIKRQAAKFFIYGLDKDGKVLGEINDSHGAEVKWSVTIANKKAGWYNFDLALDIPAAAGDYDSDGNATPGGLPLLSQKRNQDYQGKDRKKLMIEPRSRHIKGRDLKGARYAFNDGKINGKKVYLGELQTDTRGRLIFLGGHGKSDSFDGKPLTTFANNEGWHDDTSDGPVDAHVTLPDGRKMKAEGGWVVTAPPNFAVGVQAFSTGYDLLVDVAARKHPAYKKKKPEFYADIYPVLKHLSINQWVNAGVQREFGWGSAYDFDDKALIKRCADASDRNRPFRQTILESFRNPNFKEMEPLAWPPLYGDAVTFNIDSTDPRNWFAVTELQYKYLEKWARGKFTTAKPPKPKRWGDMCPQEQADGLTEAALEETLGGPFHPGCEFTWPMRHDIMYHDDTPFRIKRRKQPREDYGIAISQDIALADGGPLDGNSPGDITRWMAVPWQSDTSSCLSAYRAYAGEYMPTFWPARVPNDILTQNDYKAISSGVDDELKIKAFSPSSRKKWLRGYIYNDEGQFLYGSSIDDRIKGIEKFVKDWGKIGIIVGKDLAANPELFPQQVWVETGRSLKPDPEAQVSVDVPAWLKGKPKEAALMNPPPVLVVGLGPAGAATAIFLARLGIEVVAVDRQPKSGLVIGESLPPDAAKMLRQLGVWDEFQDSDHLKCYGNKSYWHSEEVNYHDFMQHPQGHGWHIDRVAFEHMLRQKVADLGVAMELQTKVCDLRQEGDLWQVELQSKGQSAVTRPFSLVVDATGRNSWVARNLGVERLYEALQLALVGFGKARADFDDSTTLVETAGEGWWYSAQTPGNRMATAYFFENNPSTRPRLSNEQDWWHLVAKAKHTSARLASSGFQMIEPARVVAADSSILEQIAGERWLAVGDAAMTYDPIASHGLMMSMVSGRDGAYAIAATLNGQSDALQRYGRRLYQSFMAYAEMRKQFYSNVATNSQAYVG